MARGHVLRHQDELVALSVTSDAFKITRRIVSREEGALRPLFTGHSTAALGDGQIVIMGGGATCFSMGTFWNKGVYSLGLPSSDETSTAHLRWVHERTIDIIPGEKSVVVNKQQANSDVGAQIKSIERIRLKTKDDFATIVRAGQPVILECLDLGNCVSAWNLGYIGEKVGKENKVCTNSVVILRHPFI